MPLYPVLVRDQSFNHHTYTLRLADNIEVRLTEEQVQSLGQQIERDQAPISEADLATMRADLAEIRANRAEGKTAFGECGCGSTSCGVLDREHKCWCAQCNPGAWWMVTCGRCGDKRCPGAMNHRQLCRVT